MDVFLIKDGIVENVICAESTEYANTFYPDHTCIERTVEIPFGLGDLYDGSTFTAAPLVVLPPQPITRLDFLRRFTANQRISIRQVNDPIIVDALQMLDLATDVSLDDPDVIMFVNYIASQGFITTEDANRILGVTL